MIDAIYTFDNAILDFFQSIHFPLLNKFMVFVTSLGNGGRIWIGLSLVLLFFKKTRKAGIASAIALIFGLIICNLTLKELVQRARPCFQEFAEYEWLIKTPSDYSFPSGHTTSAFASALAASCFFRNKAFVISSVTLAAIIAISRIYLYVHFPTDVIAGLIIGVICAILGVIITNFIYKKLSKNLG